MRTDAVVVPGTVAIEAEGLKPLFWKPVLAQPRVESTASANLATVLIAIVMNMVNGKNFGSVLTTARTLPTISCKRFLTKIGLPDHDVGFLTLHSANMLEPIAIIAQQLKSLLGKTVLAKPPIETMAFAIDSAMISAIIVDMVYHKESRMRFAADNTFAAIGSKDLITKLITPLLLISMTKIAEMTSGGRTSKALTTFASLSFLNRKLAVTLILMSTDLLLFFRRFGEQSFTVFLNHPTRPLWMSPVVIMATRLAGNAKSQSSTFLMPVLRGFRKIAATAGAMFQRGILGYNIHTDETTFHSSRSGVQLTPPGHHILLPQVYHRSA
jgi:hypothetical protein